MDLPETRYAKTIDGVHVAYQVLGDGPVDLLSVGIYFSHLEHRWESPIDASMNRSLAECGRLIIFDGRGTGLSDPVAGDRLPTLEERIDDIRAVLDAAGSASAVLVTFADAGPLSCLFAATYPDRARALILCNTHPRSAWAPDYPWGMTPEEYERDLEATESRWGTLEYAAEITAETIGADHEEAPVMTEWWAKEMRLSASPGAAASLLRMYHEMDVRHVLPAIHVPTLVLHGDAITEESEALSAAIPGAVRHLIPGPSLVAPNPQPYMAEIRRFVNEVQDEEADLDRVLATVLFTDIVGSTQRAAELGDRAWGSLVARHHAFVRGVIARWRGHEIDTAGDGFFASFDGPARGIRAAKAIADGVSSLGLQVRVGLHTGECEVIDGKIGGLSVVIGSRIASMAAPSEVLTSQTVKDLVAGSGLRFEDAGEHELKGVPDRWRLYRVVS